MFLFLYRACRQSKQINFIYPIVPCYGLRASMSAITGCFEVETGKTESFIYPIYLTILILMRVKGDTLKSFIQ